MRNYHINNKTDIRLHNVLYSYTSSIDYSMSRIMILEDMPDTAYDEYVLVDGGHCSCYDFDETKWDATVYTRSELIKVAENYRELKSFIKYYFNL